MTRLRSGRTGRARRPRFGHPAIGVAIAAALLALPLAPAVGASAAPASTSGPSGTWTKAASLPSNWEPRWGFSVTYFPPMNEVVLFGGAPTSGTSWYNDTWIYSNSTGQWSRGPSAPSGLTPRDGAAMGYDPTLGQIVLFGGEGAGWPADNDTWLFDGTSWQPGPAAPPGLTPRAGARMVFDPDLNEMVMFGGTGSQPYNDTWLFDGTSWQPGPPTPAAVSPREFFGMAYDPNTGQILVAGGDGAADAWYFDGTNWTSAPSLPGTANGRERIQLAYNSDDNAMMFFGGVGRSYTDNQMWALPSGGSKWVVVKEGALKPAARLDAGTVWDAGSNSLMVVAGIIGSTGRGALGYQDTWLFTTTSLAAGPGRSSTEPAPVTGAGLNIPRVPARETIRPAANGNGSFDLITTHDGQYWRDGSPILLTGGMIMRLQTSPTAYQEMGSWGMNLVRIKYDWSELEPDPPVYQNGAWTYTWDSSYLQEIMSNIQYAQDNGLYVLLTYFPVQSPTWLLNANYNSHHTSYPHTKAGFEQASADFWSDTLRQQFTANMLSYLAQNVMNQPNIFAYEVMNEPDIGNLPPTAATTATTLGVQLSLAKAIRQVDPSHTIVFTTNGPIGVGVQTADLSGFQALGNVAFDIHDYFDGRWGDGFNEANPSSPYYEQVFQQPYSMTNQYSPGNRAPYDGNTEVQVRWMSTVQRAVAAWGIPTLVGEIGDRYDDPGAYRFWGTATAAANYLSNIAWCADWTGSVGITLNTHFRPYAGIVQQAVLAHTH